MSSDILVTKKRAAYGKQIVEQVSSQLIIEYGNSFSEKNLRRMLQFATTFPNKEIVVSLIRQLWLLRFDLCHFERSSIITLSPKTNDMTNTLDPGIRVKKEKKS